MKKKAIYSVYLTDETISALDTMAVSHGINRSETLNRIIPNLAKLFKGDMLELLLKGECNNG